MVGGAEAVTVGFPVIVGAKETVGISEGDGEGIAVSVGAGESVGSICT